eukprot:355982-Chlamydomonas_euryale.AAC.14
MQPVPAMQPLSAQAPRHRTSVPPPALRLGRLPTAPAASSPRFATAWHRESAAAASRTTARARARALAPPRAPLLLPPPAVLRHTLAASAAARRRCPLRAVSRGLPSLRRPTVAAAARLRRQPWPLPPPPPQRAPAYRHHQAAHRLAPGQS